MALIRTRRPLSPPLPARPPQIEADRRFEIAAPPRFALVCFRLAGASNEVNAAWAAAINRSGEQFLTATELEGRVTLRMAICGANTQQRHVSHAWAAILAAADEVLGPKAGV